MDSRVSAPYNIRAAQIRMIPGGPGGIPINSYEGGEPSVKILPIEMIPNKQEVICGAPRLSDIGATREYLVEKYTRTAYAKDNVFTGVLDTKNMNAQYTKVPGSYYETRNFDIIGSEKYPEPPILYNFYNGTPTRTLGRSNGIRYKR